MWGEGQGLAAQLQMIYPSEHVLAVDRAVADGLAQALADEAMDINEVQGEPFKSLPCRLVVASRRGTMCLCASLGIGWGTPAKAAKLLQERQAISFILRCVLSLPQPGGPSSPTPAAGVACLGVLQPRLFAAVSFRQVFFCAGVLFDCCSLRV